MREFVSQTDLGRLFGVSSHAIGKWLIDCALRTPEKRPSRKAFAEGFVQKTPYASHGGYFYAWHQRKTVHALQAAGHRLRGQYEPIFEKRLQGPFEARESSTNGIELVDGNGEVGIWVVGQSNADRLVRLLNLACQHGHFN